jgi:hypothetical protein
LIDYSRRRKMKLPNSITWIRKARLQEDPEKELTEFSFLSVHRTWAFRLLAVIVVAATIAGQVESFNGLYNWFSTHGVTGFWADFAPLMVDSFTVIGELAIFGALTAPRHWHWRKRFMPWMSVILGLGASVAGNVGDKSGHPLSWQLTAMIPPLAGAFGIMIGFSVLKSLAGEKAQTVAIKASSQRLAALKAEVIPQTMISVEGLRELEEEPFRVATTPLEAPKPKGIDVLIPPVPRADPIEPVPVESIESGRSAFDVSSEFAMTRVQLPKPTGVVGETGQFPALP